MKVLFVYPNYRSVSLVPAGIALLSRLLKNESVDVQLFDTTGYALDPGKDYEALAQKALGFRPAPMLASPNADRDIWSDLNHLVDSFGPDLIALSCTESTFLLGVEVVRRIERREAPVILGGIFATAAPLKALSFPEIDMVCVGEGEITLPELCRKMEKGDSVEKIPGLWLKVDGRIIKNEPAPLVELDNNPVDFDLGLFSPDRLLRPMDGVNYRMAPVETARGCPYRCTFCNSPGQPLRKKSMRRVLEELRHYRDKFHVEYNFFWADTFLSISRRELDEFCELYREIALPFWIQTRVETISEPVFRKLKDVGLHKVALGIESGDEKFRRERMKKMFTNSQAIKGLAIIADLGIAHNTNNIVGYPFETRENALETARLNAFFPKADVNCFVFAPYHGTVAREEAVRAGFLDSESIAPGNAEESVLRMPQFSSEEIGRFRRCFAFYSKFPESRWAEVKRAETDDVVWQVLEQEYREMFFQ